MESVLVHHHLGLGDHFICNGLVYTLLERYDRIFLPSKRQHANTVRCLYGDEPRIEVFAVDDEERDVRAFADRAGCPMVRVGFEHCDRHLFDVSFYEQMQVPFDYRYSRFRLPRVIPNEDEIYAAFGKGDAYCLVHRESSGGLYALDMSTELPIVSIQRHTDPFNNLLNYRKLIAGASEIHCINSSVFHLVDSIRPGARLFYHDVRKRNFSIRDCWTVVDYGSAPVWRTLRGAVARVRLLRANARATAAGGRL